jgi:tetratricopeptide (TPR) repeat protein
MKPRPPAPVGGEDETVAPESEATWQKGDPAPADTHAPGFGDTLLPASGAALGETVLPAKKGAALGDTLLPAEANALGETLTSSSAALDATRPSGAKPVVEHDLALEVGSTVGRYVVLSRLGAGGMGVVLAAYDPELDRKVALKLVRPSYAGTDVTASRARMLREAQAMARLAHPNVIGVHDVGTYDGDIFVAMELVEGTTLAGWLKDAERSQREILSAYRDAGRGLAAAHDAGLIHRDFKPDNVMVGTDGRVRVMDFGLARATEDGESPPDVKPRTSALSMELTRAGSMMGTPVYMAPEQWEGRATDARCDQFSFCVALWEALYRVRPFIADSVSELADKVMLKPPDPPPTSVRVPRRLQVALRRGLEKEPSKRFPSMHELLAELVEPPGARRWLALGAGAVVLAGSAAFFAFSGGEDQEDNAGCADPSVQLASVWDPPRREAAKAAVLATKLPQAAETWARIEKQMEARAAEYMRVFAPTCRGEYTIPEGQRAVQDACLGRVRADLAAFTEVLAEVVPDELDRSLRTAWGLPGAARCQDPTVLAAKVPPPSDPKVAAEARVLRDEMSRASARSDAGRYKEALAMVEAVLPKVKALGHPHLVGEAQLMIGSLASVTGDKDRAHQVLLEAYDSLLAAGDDLGAARAAINIANIIGVAQQKFDAARDWVERDAAGLLKRAGSPPDLELKRLATAGALRRVAGDIKGARAIFEQQLALSDKTFAENDPRRAGALDNLAGMLLEQGELEPASKMVRRSLELTIAGDGPEHPDVAMVQSNLGLILAEQGQLEEAEDLQRRSLALREKLYGDEHPDVVISLMNLGFVLNARGKVAEAIQVSERTLALSEKINGPEHPDTADSLENLAEILAANGKRPRAVELQTRVVAIRTKVLEPKHPDIERAKKMLADFSGKEKKRQP